MWGVVSLSYRGNKYKTAFLSFWIIVLLDSPTAQYEPSAELFDCSHFITTTSKDPLKNNILIEIAILQGRVRSHWKKKKKKKKTQGG